MAGDDADDELSGCRSSGYDEVIESEGKSRGIGLLELLRDALMLLVALECPTDHRRATGDELPRRISSGSGGIGA